MRVWVQRNTQYDCQSAALPVETHHVHIPSLVKLLEPDHAVSPLSIIFWQHLRLKFYA
jgi:hypothetical protein